MYTRNKYREGYEIKSRGRREPKVSIYSRKS